MRKILLVLSITVFLTAVAIGSRQSCIGHSWANSSDLADQINKKDAVMAKAVLASQEFVQQHPKSCSVPIEIKVLTPFGDATGSFDQIKEELTMRIPTGKTTFKVMTLSIKDYFWALTENGVTESTGTFDVTKSF